MADWRQYPNQSQNFHDTEYTGKYQTEHPHVSGNLPEQKQCTGLAIYGGAINGVTDGIYSHYIHMQVNDYAWYFGANRIMRNINGWM